MITSLSPSSNDLIDPLMKTDYDITLNLYPDLKTGKVQTNFPYFSALSLSRYYKACW